MEPTNNNSNNVLTSSTETIKNLVEKYKDNDYILQRIYNHVVTYLPNTLENEAKNHDKRVNRISYLSNEQQIFIQVFLSKHKYFYLPNNNLFYEYNGENYFIVKEDDVIHKLLSTISKDRILLQWKHKTKINVIRQIKDRGLFSSIPETDTIQNVLNVLYPAIFSSKNEAKYFLTVIGDNIFKKPISATNIFLINQQMKQFLNEIDSVAISSIGNSNTIHNFMTKYHENHSYENCRLIRINNKFSKEVWRDLLKKIGLDLLCVAAHYSKRYENADNFINTKSDNELKKFTYYLKNTTQAEIVNEFCDKCLIATTSAECKMEWKNLHFVWKQFLSMSNLPNVIYSSALKCLLKERYNSYDESSDTFSGITSKYIPIHNDFITFWQETINMSTTVFENDLEIDEICSLFKSWAEKSPASCSHFCSNISEENVLKILKHFFPTVEIIEDKYVLNVECALWNKTKDIIGSFNYIRENAKKGSQMDLISFDDAYNLYYKYCKSSNTNKSIISKRYFEKYFYNKFSEHIVHEKFIGINCLV